MMLAIDMASSEAWVDAFMEVRPSTERRLMPERLEKLDKTEAKVQCQRSLHMYRGCDEYDVHRCMV